MVTPNQSTYFDNCPRCKKYKARIEDLEKIDKDHRKLNSKLRKEIANIYFLIGNLDDKESKYVVEEIYGHQ